MKRTDAPTRPALHDDEPTRSSRRPRRHATVFASLARTLCRAAVQRSVDVEAVLARIDLSASTLEPIDGRIPYESLMSLIDALAEESRDPVFGLHVAEAFVDAATFGIVGFASRSASTLRAAIERTVRFARVMNENTEAAVRYEPRGAMITDGPIRPLHWPRHYAELAIASFMVLSRRWTGGDFAALSVGFEHGAPADTTEHRRLFGVMPTFGAPSNHILLPSAVLDLPLPELEPELGRYLVSRLDDAASTLSSNPSSLREVREAIRRALPGGRPTLRDVSRSLAVSERTLQRRLLDQETTFADVLDETRHEVALLAIGDPRASVTEIAFVCGYADVKAFRRAFHRWTGLTPREHRARLLTDGD